MKNSFSGCTDLGPHLKDTVIHSRPSVETGLSALEHGEKSQANCMRSAGVSLRARNAA